MYTDLRPTYGGAREHGRHPRGYRALGRVQYLGLGQAAVTLTGRARYFTGKVETVRRFVQDGPCDTCESYKTRFPRSNYTCAPKSSPAGWCAFYSDHTTRDLRPGVMGAAGDSGWAVYVADLIPTTGGTLPGWARLHGAIPADIQDGQDITIQGAWTGTPPNNLCTGCGWNLDVSGAAPSGTPTETGAMEQDAPEMVEARLEATAIQAEQEALAEGATPEEAAEAGVQARAQYDPAMQGQPPPLAAGVDAGTVATLALGAMLLLPFLTKKGRKGVRSGGVDRWGI